jgi:hypothetical protein
MKIRNVTLVPPDDEGYRAHQARHAQANQKLRDTLDPGPLQKLSHPVEELLRQWLGQRVPLSSRRILRYERLSRDNSYTTYYKEIDAVEVADDDTDDDASSSPRPKRLFEFKCSSNPGALSGAGTQLDRAVQAMATRWDRRRLYRHAVLVAVVPALMDLPHEPRPLTSFDASVPAEAPAEERLTTCLPADELWAWGQSEDVLDAPADLLGDAQAKARETTSRRQRREALKEQGVPREEWPDDLHTEPRETPETETATFGDEEDESPMARALREAMDDDE